MKRYYAPKSARPEDYIFEFLMHLPQDAEWVDKETLMREEVIPSGAPEDYERGLDALVQRVAVRTKTVET